MSIAAAFSIGKAALRRSAFTFTTVAALLGVNSAQAADFTRQECSLILETSRSVVKAVGAATLSTDFRRSFMLFMSPDGKSLTCSGPTQIATPTRNDIAAFSTISGILAVGKNPLDLQARGVRQVAQLSAAPASARLTLQ